MLIKVTQHEVSTHAVGRQHRRSQHAQDSSQAARHPHAMLGAPHQAQPSHWQLPAFPGPVGCQALDHPGPAAPAAVAAKPSSIPYMHLNTQGTLEACYFLKISDAHKEYTRSPQGRSTGLLSVMSAGHMQCKVAMQNIWLCAPARAQLLTTHPQV